MDVDDLKRMKVSVPLNIVQLYRNDKGFVGAEDVWKFLVWTNRLIGLLLAMTLNGCLVSFAFNSSRIWCSFRAHHLLSDPRTSDPN
jgi:hypothetical protein